MASLLCRLTWCDGVRCLARVMTHVASLLCSLVELVTWSTSLALLRLMKKYSRDVVIIHGARRRELPLPKKPFQKVWTKMEGKGSVHNLPWRKLDRWVNIIVIPFNWLTWFYAALYRFCLQQQLLKSPQRKSEVSKFTIALFYFIKISSMRGQIENWPATYLSFTQCLAGAARWIHYSRVARQRQNVCGTSCTGILITNLDSR